MENSDHGEFIPVFRRSRQPFSLIIQVIDSRLVEVDFILIVKSV